MALRPRIQIRQPLADRGRFVVDDVEHALRLLFHGQDGSARRIVEIHPRGVAGAAPDERDLPLAHELDLIVGGARPVESAVSQGRATSLDAHVLDVADRPRVQVQRILLGLTLC